MTGIAYAEEVTIGDDVTVVTNMGGTMAGIVDDIRVVGDIRAFHLAGRGWSTFYNNYGTLWLTRSQFRKEDN